MNPLADLLVTVFLGPFGVHKFLKGKVGMGVLYLCTFGLFGFGWLFDCIQAARRFAQSKSSNRCQPSYSPSETGSRQEVFFAIGVEHYLSAIARLGHENPNWGKSHAILLDEGLCGKKIYRWNYTNRPVQLIPEPSNPHDPNAVFVQVAGEKVGYIRREENRHVLDILKNHSVEQISAFIGGGPYMVVSTNGDVQTLEYSHSVKITVQYR